jgi:Na+/proline symporter
VQFSYAKGIQLPEYTDNLFPLLATGEHMPAFLGIIFMLGLIAAAYSSADSAITALTTSVTIDIFNAENLEEQKLSKLRWIIHVFVSLLIGVVIFVFRILNNEAVISTLFKAAGYTYGPLLGLYAFGLFTKLHLRDIYVPIVAICAPIFSFLIKKLLEMLINDYHASFEILVLNGFITFVGLLMISKKVSFENSKSISN